MRILQKLVDLERERTSSPSLIRRILIWLEYRMLIWRGIEKVINKKEYPDLITLLRDFTTVIHMCKLGIYKDTGRVKTYLPVLKYHLVERHASDDHYFLNHKIHYYSLIITHPIIHSVYSLSFNSDEFMIDTVEYMFGSYKDKNKFVNEGSISKIIDYRVSKYDMDGREYNGIFTIMIRSTIKELIKLIEKEGINP